MIDRSANKDESRKIIDLAVKIFKPNMGEQFIRLFSPDNHQHQMVCEEEGKIIAAVNYYLTHVDSSIGKLNVASIGAVCTEEAYRGQGISSRLLQLAQIQMKKEQVDFCIISGDGHLYRRFGAQDVGAMHRYVIESFIPTELHDARLFSGHPSELYPIYHKETIKYQRTLNEFEDLYKGQTYPDSYQTYPVHVIYKQNMLIAYVILINHPRANHLRIKEFAGDRTAIYQSLPTLMQTYKKKGIELVASITDPIRYVIQKSPERITQHATLKIIDHQHFFKTLNAYLLKHSHRISFQASGEDTILSMDQKQYILTHDQSHSLIFSGLIPDMIDRELPSDIFPIELPWSHNLNYQ